MDWTKFFTPEALATYVVFALGISLGIVSFFITRFINRKRPKIVRLVKVAEASLIEIDPEVRDDIVVTYKQTPANSLYLTTFNVSYKGEVEIIEDVEINLILHKTEIIEIIKDDPIPGRESEIIKDEENNRLSLIIPFLNRESLYQDRATIKVFALKPITVKDVTGGGRGWKVEYIDRVQLANDIATDISSSISDTDTSLGLSLGIGKAMLDVIPKFIRLRGL